MGAGGERKAESPAQRLSSSHTEPSLGCSLPLSIPLRRPPVDLFASELDDEDDAEPPSRRTSAGGGDDDDDDDDDDDEGGGSSEGVGAMENVDAEDDVDAMHVEHARLSDVDGDDKDTGGAGRGSGAEHHASHDDWPSCCSPSKRVASAFTSPSYAGTRHRTSRRAMLLAREAPCELSFEDVFEEEEQDYVYA